jgi:hypothetical protein
MVWYQRSANKYGAQKQLLKGRLYDSTGEAGLDQEIALLEKSWEVVKVKPQKTFPLFGKNGGRICNHRVEFLLTFKDAHQEIWEYKGFATEIWRIKLTFFEDNYPYIPYWVITPKTRKRYI